MLRTSHLRKRREGRLTGPREDRLSRLRQRLVDLEKRRADLLHAATAPGWMVRGSVVTQMTVCGKPGCRCARGERHGPRVSFLFQDGTRRQSVPIHPGEHEEVERRSRRYRAYRRVLSDLGSGEEEARAILREIAALHLCDAASLVEERR